MVQVGKLIEKSSKQAVNRKELKLPLIRVKVIFVHCTMTFDCHIYIEWLFYFSFHLARR